MKRRQKKNHYDKFHLGTPYRPLNWRQRWEQKTGITPPEMEEDLFVNALKRARVKEPA